jgi:hypothetical protein
LPGGRAVDRRPGQRRLRGLPRPRPDEGRRALRPAARRVRRARNAGRARPTSPTTTRATSRRRADGCRATTRRPRPTTSTS